jgi:hypothetical protein
MAQHFLLSSAARSLSIKEIYKAGEDAAYKAFCDIRWASTGGDAVCPVVAAVMPIQSPHGASSSVAPVTTSSA